MIDLHEIVRQYPLEMQQSVFYDQLTKEYFHHHMLRSLFSGKHAGKIAFLGGTALRYFYGIKRFSEDLDFDCFSLSKDEFIEMTDKVEKDLQYLGYDIHIEDRLKTRELNAFRRVYVFPQLKYKLGISPHKESKFFIKIEAEPHHFKYNPEVKTLIGFGIMIPVRTAPLEILFSTKIAAALKRKKDRDFYDVISLIHFARPDFGYLEHKCQIRNSTELKDALLSAASKKNLITRKIYDCEHMLFDKNEKKKIETFTEYIQAFDFKRFD